MLSNRSRATRKRAVVVRECEEHAGEGFAVRGRQANEPELGGGLELSMLSGMERRLAAMLSKREGGIFGGELAKRTLVWHKQRSSPAFERAT